MASNYHENSSSSENTNFDDTETILTIANAIQRRQGTGIPWNRASLLEQGRNQLQGDREGNRPNFVGFRADDRPPRNTWLLPRPVDPRSRLIVSDSRNEPEYMGDTRLLHDQDKSQLATPKISGKVSNVTIPLTSSQERGY